MNQNPFESPTSSRSSSPSVRNYRFENDAIRNSANYANYYSSSPEASLYEEQVHDKMDRSSHHSDTTAVDSRRHRSRAGSRPGSRSSSRGPSREATPGHHTYPSNGLPDLPHMPAAYPGSVPRSPTSRRTNMSGPSHRFGGVSDGESFVSDDSLNPPAGEYPSHYSIPKQQSLDGPVKAIEEAAPPLKKEKRLFSWMFTNKVPPVPEESERTEFPWRKTNVFMQIGFWWIYPILKRGYIRTLVPRDLWILPKNLTVEDMHHRFEQHLNAILVKQEAQHLKKYPDLSNFKWPVWVVPWAIFLTFKWQYTMSTVWLALAFACQTLSPLVTKEIIDFVQYRSFGAYTSDGRGVWLTIIAVIMIFLNGVLINHFFHDAMFTGAQTKAILTKAVLLKSFKLSPRSRYLFPRGRITSLMSTDLAKIDLAIGFQPLLLAFPVPIIISVVILILYIGVQALAGLGLFIVSLAICAYLTSFLYTFRQSAVVHTDKRINMVREAVANIKIIKFYAWEQAYKYGISQARNDEMSRVFRIKTLRNFIAAYAVSLPSLTSMLSFVVLWATHSMRAPGYVFSSLSLFTILAQSIMLVPYALATGADALIGFKRLTDFLSSEEGDQYVQRRTSTILAPNGPAVVIRHANFVWEQFHDNLDNELWANNDTFEGRRELQRMERERRRVERREHRRLAKRRKHNIYEEKEYDVSGSSSGFSAQSSREKSFPGLLDLNLTINRGEFIMVCGSIGSGKSSLLHAIAGSMNVENPSTAVVDVNAESIFCSEPWIQNATIRDNILFGREYDDDLYKEVIFACALEEDILNLPGGDKTEIGERGVTLSGGQKARVSLARACYSNAPILLFDDVLSAVDSRVAKHIISYLFQGLLINKTVVLATHQLSVLEAADRVVFLNGDGSISVGTIDHLLATVPAFDTLVKNNVDSEMREMWTSGNTRNNSMINLQQWTQGHPDEIPVDNSDAIARVLSDTNRDAIGKSMRDEEKAVNAIGWSIYAKYLRLGSGSFGVFAVPIFLMLVALATFFQLFSNTWLSFWTEKRYPHMSENLYVGLYIAFSFLTVIFTALEFTMLTYIENVAAQLLNIGAMERIMHAPMSYMDTTPLGRILNRFTKDTDSLDNELGEQAQYFIFPLASMIGIIILCICYLPWFAIAVPFLVIVFMLFANFYQGSAREVKRLEAIQRSLVFNNFNETLTGMQTIQSYHMEPMFVAKNDYFINKMNEAYYITISTQRWLAVNLDIMGACFALIICLLCITGQFHISPSSTGLLLSYVVQIVGLLSLTVRAMTQVENEMNAAERLHHYAFKLPQEPDYIVASHRPPANWPPSGYISFSRVALRYRPELPRVLDDFSLKVYPGEKVGICGRTGAGKSSIMNALYRLTEVEDGSITIDGLNIADMGLFDLRSRLSIIPQDPVLFQGSIRKNLDPFNDYNDEVLWDALRRSGLLDETTMIRIRNSKYDPSRSVGYEDLHKFHLDQMVDDDGSNFSLGEKQLLALARALVRNSKILILDEATSSVDFDTDQRIQQTISTEFRHCTILCIAHRLKTILHYDRIVVMDKGSIAEKGTPWGLFKKGGGFRQMCEKAGITGEDFA
ncbi:oligomycin resistance ATP-dependent permease Yor1p [Diutina catenulata]